MNVDVSVHTGAIYNRRVMMAFYFDRVLEVWLDVIKRAAQSHGVVRVNFWFGYARRVHVDKHPFPRSHIDLFIRHLRA